MESRRRVLATVYRQVVASIREPTAVRVLAKRLTINRKFHVATKRYGVKQIQNGTILLTPTNRVPRISHLLALTHHCFRLVRTGAIINQSELVHFKGQTPKNNYNEMYFQKRH